MNNNKLIHVRYRHTWSFYKLFLYRIPCVIKSCWDYQEPTYKKTSQFAQGSHSFVMHTTVYQPMKTVHKYPCSFQQTAYVNPKPKQLVPSILYFKVGNREMNILISCSVLIFMCPIISNTKFCEKIKYNNRQQSQHC